MRKSFYRIEMLSGVAAAALIAGTGTLFAEQMMPAADKDTSDRFLAVAKAMQGDADVAANDTPDVEVEGGLYRKVTVPVKGVYNFAAAPGTGLKLYIDGTLAIDTTGPALEDDSTPIKALQALSAGAHAIRIEGADGNANALEVLTFAALGAEPRTLAEVSEEISPQEEATLAAENASVMPSTTTASAASENGGGLLGVSNTGGKEGFSIGGSSSKTARAPAASGGEGGSTNAGGASGGMSPGMLTTAALAPATQSSTPASTTSSGGGGISSIPSSSGGGGGGTAAPGTPGAPGTPTAAPAPTLPPAPAVDPSVAPTPETVQASPLSPPTGVEITQAVQLTSAGNINGQVPATGSTLFGAVMSSSVFDIVNVSVSGSNRTTTVDVGPMTGQFAVRLFPEDFATSNAVQVTLTGASSASDEVEATPVTYTVTGMPAQDGVAQALSRLTFGATPDLYARVRAMGFQNYLEEQLAPESINDAALNAMNPASILRPTERNSNTLLRSLVHYDIAHAAFSEKQLQEVIGHFWANHFHAVTKDTNIVQQNITDRQFFRDNAFGTFAELLLYSARSPLMSQYLDNDQNRFRENRENEGINENYGREILELSTVGVESGYTSADVDMVSRVFSGWRYERTNPNAEDVAETYQFVYNPGDHDPQDKLIPFLGVTIAGREGAEGVQEGEELIAILANHPSTQARTCRKLVQLLVADNPPDGFVTTCVAAWGDGGDIEAMLRAILLNPAYVNTAAYQRNKAKTPFEYAVSVIRAFGARPDNPSEDDFWNRFRQAHENAGHNYVRSPVPTGLPEVSAAWLNSASMVGAYNQITDIAERRQDYGIDLAADITEAGLETAEEVAAYLLAIGTADQFTLGEFDSLVATLKGEDGIFEPRVQDETAALERAMGLVVVSPSFQLQ
ncbi:MAG: DUF1800 family protein [Paracoccaceae bacterium]